MKARVVTPLHQSTDGKELLFYWFAANPTSTFTLSYDHSNPWWHASPPAYLAAARHVRDVAR
jgi:hypothetical protein